MELGISVKLVVLHMGKHAILTTLIVTTYHVAGNRFGLWNWNKRRKGEKDRVSKLRVRFGKGENKPLKVLAMSVHFPFCFIIVFLPVLVQSPT